MKEIEMEIDYFVKYIQKWSEDIIYYDIVDGGLLKIYKSNKVIDTEIINIVITDEVIDNLIEEFLLRIFHKLQTPKMNIFQSNTNRKLTERDYIRKNFEYIKMSFKEFKRGYKIDLIISK
jgi:hypothetical protein